MKFKKYLLKSYPSNLFPQDLSCFQLINNAQIDDNNIPEGFTVIKIFWVSLDPLLRTWISGARSYLDPVRPGSSIPGFGIGKIVKVNLKKGNKAKLEEGDWVIGMLQWSQYVLIDYTKIHKLPIVINQLLQELQNQQYKFLTVYGPTGFTSYWSIKTQIVPFKIWDKLKGRNKNKEQLNIVISSAAGGVGLTVVQYLYQLGYRNIYGIVGTDQKCEIAKKYGCKDAINYKKYYSQNTINSSKFEGDVSKMLNGEQIDVYYENVGQDMLSSMLKLMANHSKIVMCGATATYNNWSQKSGVKNFQQVIFKRIQVKGILYYGMDFNERVKALIEMMGFEMKGAEVIINGIQKLPEVYRDMIDGKYIGKPIVQFI